MLQIARGVAFALATVIFIWSSDPLVGLVLALCALAWAVEPLFTPPQGSETVRSVSWLRALRSRFGRAPALTPDRRRH